MSEHFFCYIAQKIEFLSEPKTFTYLFNKSEIDLKWEYKVSIAWIIHWYI